MDLACGRGANSILMARQGLCVDAWDISDVAINFLADQAKRGEVQVNPQVRDVVVFPPVPDSYDVVLVSFFLERELMPALVKALKPGGLLFYQTYNAFNVTGNVPSNPDFRLKENELLTLFPTLRLVYYCENGELGDTTKGVRDISMFIGRKL